MVGARNSTTIIHLLKEKDEQVVSAIGEYEQKFGIGPIWVVRVPARLCLAADHTDYWLGFTPELITMASDSQSMIAIIGPRDDELVSCHSNNTKFQPWDFDISENVPETNDWLSWLKNNGSKDSHWSNYIIGSIKYCQMFENINCGFNISISSTIPPASGASSSSALATCGMFAIRLANSLPIDALKMAQNTAEAEWFCGTRGGMMDHATMMFGEKNAALKLTFNPFTNEIIPLPKEIANGKFTMLYTHPSEKGGEILMAFNELSFVAREIVPRLLPNKWNENWAHELDKLPNIMSKEDVRNTWPNEFQSFQKLYPALFESDFKIRIADRFQFAMKEFERSKLMQNCLQNENCTIQDIGNIMNNAWVDAGKLYGIRTELMDSFAMQAKDIPGVFGIKVMGAGFGGNLLILSERGSDLSSLGKERLLECSAGDAATILDVEALMPINEKMPPLAAVLLCGGKGTRMLDQGIDTHKPLLKLNGVPSTKLVVSQLLDSDLDFSQIIIVIPPERKNEYVDALDGLDVKIVIQHNALGTGNAVYCALDELLSPIEQIYVSFGTQPLVRSKTIVSSLAYHQSKGVGFTLPTTLRENPYAPLLRDANGVVIGSIETHLDGVEMPAFGETNVGGYWVSRVALEKVLSNLHAKLFDEENNVYKTNSGELGFPNEMTKGCLEMKLGVEGIAIADPEEVVGLKTPEHIGEIERWLNKPWRR